MQLDEQLVGSSSALPSGLADEPTRNFVQVADWEASSPVHSSMTAQAVQGDWRVLSSEHRS